MRPSGAGNHAGRRVSVFLRLQRLRRLAEAESGRLLRLLFLRRHALSADPDGTQREFGTSPLLLNGAPPMKPVTPAAQYGLSFVVKCIQPNAPKLMAPQLTPQLTPAVTSAS
jgi:hypothetical protein